MAYKIAVSISTNNVLTATDPNDFIFNSDLNTFKILAEGNLTNQTIDSNPKTISLEHGQSSTPTFFAFCDFDYDHQIRLPEEIVNLSYYWYVTVDATYLNFVFTKPGANYDVDIKYYIFEAPGT